MPENSPEMKALIEGLNVPRRAAQAVRDISIALQIPFADVIGSIIDVGLEGVQTVLEEFE